MSSAPATGFATPAADLTTANARPSAADSGETSLSRLEPGAEAVIVGVSGAGPESLRLRDLGFVAGTRIRCIKRAPLGDPVAYDVRGTHLCLRRSESDRVRVRRD
jgi:ferrous iron transport protein A